MESVTISHEAIVSRYQGRLAALTQQVIEQDATIEVLNAEVDKLAAELEVSQRPSRTVDTMDNHQPMSQDQAVKTVQEVAKKQGTI